MEMECRKNNNNSNKKKSFLTSLSVWGDVMRVNVLSILISAIMWSVAVLFAIGILIVPIYAVVYVIGG